MGRERKYLQVNPEVGALFLQLPSAAFTDLKQEGKVGICHNFPTSPPAINLEPLIGMV